MAYDKGMGSSHGSSGHTGSKTEKPKYSKKSVGNGQSLNMDGLTAGGDYGNSLNQSQQTAKGGKYPAGFGSTPIPKSEQ